MYNSIKKSPSKNLSEYISSSSQPSEKGDLTVNSKRKAEESLSKKTKKKLKVDDKDEDEDYYGEKEEEKDVIGDEEGQMFSSLENSQNSVIKARPRRTGSDRKPLVISDNESDGNKSNDEEYVL